MAIIVDPDNLDRQQIIFGTNTQEFSFYPVGALSYNDGTDGAVGVAGSPVGLSSQFTSASYGFTVNDEGKHIIIESGNNIGSYEITAYIDANTVTVDRDFTITESAITFTIASGTTAGASLIFEDVDKDFTSLGVNIGDILCIYSGPNAGHYYINTVGTTTVTVDSFTGFTAFTAYGAIGSPNFEVIAYNIHEATGGTAADGATLQSIYSFSKEEWRVDSFQFNRDNLIKHEFPWEAITAEQFEIGGGAAHAEWAFFNGPQTTDTVIHYVRTGGWAAKNTAGTTLNEYAGIITLGSLDTDAQVYYQQVSVSTAPTDFILTGAVNQSILIRDTTGSPDDDRRTFLKLFVRKKGKTYAGSEIADIGVTTIQTIVNRFPLAHIDDSAIVDTDGDIVSTTPYTNAVVDRGLADTIDGVTTAGTGTFTDSDIDFTAAGVRVGDSLRLTAGADAADTYPAFTWNIIAVGTTTLTVSIADQAFVGDTAITYEVHTSDIVAPQTDGVLSDIDTVTGTITSASTPFAPVGVGDMVVINEPSNEHSGVYKVTDISGAPGSVIVDTTDRAFTGGTLTAIDFYVTEPGMYLEYKWDQVVAPTADGGAGYTYADDNPDTITSTGTPWGAVTAGDIAIVSGSTSNDGSYTVASATSNTLTLVGTDTLTVEATDTTGTIEIRQGFKRTIQGVVYGYQWRLYGNGASAADCYQFIQHQLRQTTDIDYGDGVSRGDVTDLLMSFSTPTGVTDSLIIDDISSADINNVTFGDATGVGRLFAFVAAGTISFNNNLQDDTSAKYWMFFTNDDAGDNTGRDYGTKDAIIVLDGSETPVQITGDVGGAPSVGFTYDYTNNIQRGSASAGLDAPVTVVAIGLDTAQFVITTGTIEQSKANNFSLVAALERNYSNP